MKMKSVVAAGLLVVVLFGVASASSLPLQHTATLHVSTAARCSTGQIAVTLSNPLLIGNTIATITRPTGCSQGTVTVYARAYFVGTHTATAGPGQNTATFDSRMVLINITSVLATVDTWVMPTTRS